MPYLFLFLLLMSPLTHSAAALAPPASHKIPTAQALKPAKKAKTLLPRKAVVQVKNFVLTNPFSDFPVSNNIWVEHWIKMFQNGYSASFRIWLERSYRYLPMMQAIFQKEGLPKDLIYMAMIESGFSAQAVSSASAVGYWQFLQATGRRFGLRKTSWLDERKDFEKSTTAAGQYLKWLHKKFGSWLLAAAAYNMGEQKLSYLIKKHRTKNFWSLAQKFDFPYETAHYIPKLMAAIMIAKAPSLYGFNYLYIKTPYNYEAFYLPGGTNLRALAKYIGRPYQTIQKLNPALLTPILPDFLENWRVRIPEGSGPAVSRFVQKQENINISI